MIVTFTVADDIPFALKVSAEEFSRDVRFLSALMWYRKKQAVTWEGRGIGGLQQAGVHRAHEVRGESHL